MRTPNNERLTPDTADFGQACADGPERRCVLSGEVQAQSSLIRLALSPDGLVLPDAFARAPGRGAWLGVSQERLAQALASGHLRAVLARAFKGKSVFVPEDLPQRVEQALRQALRDRLGLALRAGMLTLGTDRIARAARMGNVAMLLHASDAGMDGRKKLDQAWRVGQNAEGSAIRGTVLPLDREALSVALGRSNVVHLAVTDQNTASRIAQIILRLRCFLGADAQEAVQEGLNDDIECVKD